MATSHQQARQELDTLATEIARRIFNVAFPKLKQKYDRGAKEPREEVSLPGSVSRQLYDMTDGDIDLLEEVVQLVREKAEEMLISRLGPDCKSVDIYPAGGMKRGDKLEVSVLARFH